MQRGQDGFASPVANGMMPGNAGSLAASKLYEPGAKWDAHPSMLA